MSAFLYLKVVHLYCKPRIMYSFTYMDATFTVGYRP